MPFRALIIVTSTAVTLKLNMEQASEHKRVACVLFLDLYLKRSLSEMRERSSPWQERERVLPSS